MTGKRRRALERSTFHQRLDSLVHITEPLFQSHQRLAAGGEAEMSRFDDSGMHRPDGNLMQVFALHRKKGIAGAFQSQTGLSEWAVDIPTPVIEPRTLVRSMLGNEPVEVPDGSFESNSRRMELSDRWERAARTFEAQHPDGALLEQRHVHALFLAPQPEQRQRAVCELACGKTPNLRVDDHARPGLVSRNPASLGDKRVEHRHPSRLATC